MKEQLLDKKFKALANENRRTILLYLKSGKKCTGEIAKQFSISAPSVSNHLAILKDSHLISAVNLKGFIYYELRLEELDEIIQWLYEMSNRK